jgi:hypothetical protein
MLLAGMMPKPRLRTVRRCQALVPARWRRKGSSTRMVPMLKRCTASSEIRRSSPCVQDEGVPKTRFLCKALAPGKGNGPGLKAPFSSWLVQGPEGPC